MIQLGLSGFYHDSAAALVIDGKVICAIEEEKLSGEKHDSSFPFKAIQWCLDYTKIRIDEVDMVCWYEDPKIKYERVKKFIGKWGGLRFPKKWRKFNNIVSIFIYPIAININKISIRINISTIFIY